MGSVAEGLRADLILLEDDPLEDVSRASRPLGVMLGGRWLPRDELRGMLDALAERCAGRKQSAEDGR